MKPFFVQKNSFLLLLLGIVVISASAVYLFTAENAIMPRTTGSSTAVYPPLAKLTPSLPAKACASTQRNFQKGIAFPQWGSTAYGERDAKWLTELPEMRTQTGACWVEIPLLFYQSSLTSTKVTQGLSTPTVSSFDYGIHYAHALGLYIFVTPLLQVSGSQPWAGAIQFSTLAHEQQWFESYWKALKPYVLAASQAHVEQLALGTEYEWLQEHAPDSLWNELITRLRSVFPGTLTYDMNWTSLQKPPRSWMYNANLKMIGISAYLPLIHAPERVEPRHIFALWKQTIKRALDNFALKLGEPIFISEIGYRNSADALYHSWEPTSSAPPDPEEQASACDAALANIVPDQHILGSFFWGWDDVQAFRLAGQPAATVIHTYYRALQV
jgi:hypothetical protein